MRKRRRRPRKSFLRIPLVMNIGGWVTAQILRLLLCTVRVYCEYCEPDGNPRRSSGKGRIFCLWHENLLPLGYHYSGLGIKVLTSRSRDGDIFRRTLEILGFGTIRGSSSRGGASAVRSIIRSSAADTIAITPDGPRGPRREFQLGAVFLGSHTGMPLFPIGLAYERLWRLRSWDRMAIPRPFSKVVICIGPALVMPERTDKRLLESHRHQIAALMQESTQRAESLLARIRSGERLPVISPEAKAMKAGPLRKSA